MLYVYSAEWCSFCDKLKKFMDENNVVYTVVDIDEELDKAEWLVGSGYKTLPQVFDQQGNYKGDCASFINTYSK